MGPFNCPPDVCGGGYMDASCVLYHLAGFPASGLINLNLPNQTPVDIILNAIDALLGTAISGQTLVPVSTPAISFLGSGPGNRILTPSLLLSGASGQTASIKSDGLYVPDLRDGKVKINASDFPDYLLNKVVGATDGIVSVSFVLDPSGSNLAAIIPSLNVIALANNSAFDTALANNSTFISAISGQVSGSTSANNGLSVSGGNVQLGGTLIKATAIDFSGFTLKFFDNPEFYIGEGSPSGGAVFQIDNAYTSNGKTIASSVNTIANLGTVALVGSNGNVVIEGGVDTQGSAKAGVVGQIGFVGAGPMGLNPTNAVSYGGVLGVMEIGNTGNITGTTFVANGVFQGSAASSGNVTNWASVMARGIYQTPGPSYTGTVTNYYGLYIEDLTTGVDSQITNKYAIYQAGTTDVSRFFGPVQNAGGTVQFTSDARIKENFKVFERGLNEIEQLETKTYNYTYNKGVKVTGIVAQDLENIMPEAVSQGHFATPTGEEYHDFRMVDQNVLFYAMINAIKELSATNRSLNKRLTALEGAK
jgi:Chaperone of endosialidase